VKKDKPKRKYTKKVKGPVLTNTTVVKETALAPIPRGSLVSVDPQALIAQAIDKGLPLESMERLLAMRRELKAEWAKEQYFEALARFQAACPNIIKDKDVLDRDGKFRYSYAPLDVIVTAVKGALDANGFSYTIQTASHGRSLRDQRLHDPHGPESLHEREPEDRKRDDLCQALRFLQRLRDHDERSG
jgi:hypothetical protein